ncbi:hypothetical protein D3C71_1326140 [compost metagenome]
MHVAHGRVAGRVELAGIAGPANGRHHGRHAQVGHVVAHALFGAVDELGRAFGKPQVAAGDVLPVGGAGHHRVHHFVGNHTVVVERRRAAIGRVGRHEVGHVHLQHQIVAPPLPVKPGDLHIGGHTARVVGKAGVADVDGRAVALQAEVAADEVLAALQPAARAGQAVKHGQQVLVAHHAGVGAVEHVHAIELRGAPGAVDFLRQPRHLGLDGLAVRRAVGVVGGLHGQLADALQAGRDALQRALGRLHERNAVVGVTHRLVEPPDLRSEPLGDRQARCVVLGTVDAQARGQALHGRGHITLCTAKPALRIQRHHVGVDRQRHGTPLGLLVKADE